jgi:hypothetical protein
MDRIILQFHYSPGFIGDFVMKDLYVSESFEFSLSYFWHHNAGYFPNDDFELKQTRRFTKIKDQLSEELKLKIQEILKLDLKIVQPEIIKTDKIVYSTSAHYKSEYYKLKTIEEEITINIPYYNSEIPIEGENKELFIIFHEELQAWIEQEFEIVSQGKAIRFNK